MRQEWNADQYARDAGFVPQLGRQLLELLQPQPGERVLDLGCGDGALTRELVTAGCEVLAIDRSVSMVNRVQERGIRAELGDGEALAFNAEFDAVFSNAALHWMLQADRVVSGIWHSLKPGGRFVAEFGGAGNVQQVVLHLTGVLAERGIDARTRNPWYFPTTTRYRALLENAGFLVSHLELFPRPTAVGRELLPWLRTFCGAFVTDLGETEREAIYGELSHRLAPHLRDNDGVWHVDYVRLRLRAEKP